MNTLEIQNLHIEVEGTQIIKDVSLTFKQGEVHALLGPNGSGKSTIAKAIMGHPKYTITKGKILLNGKDMTNAKPNERAKAGLFLSFQHPKEITGVTISSFLKAAKNATSDKKMSAVQFHKYLKQKMEELEIESSFSRRHLNVGFSGGEKKRAEMLQLNILEPKFAILDETDSGLDIDAMKIVAKNLQTIKQKNETGIIVISHYNKFLDLLQPEKVSVLFKGEVIAQGGIELAQKIEKEGFESVK